MPTSFERQLVTPDNSAEQIERINVALREIEEYKDLEEQRDKAKGAGKRHGALDDQIADMEGSACTSASKFMDTVCKDIPEIVLLGEYEDDQVKMKILPDGRVARAEGYTKLTLVDQKTAAEEIRLSRDAYREKMQELEQKLTGVEAALQQIG